MKKRNYKEDWSTYNADADSGLFQKHLKRLAEAKPTPSGKATSDLLKTVWTNYGPEGLNKYSYDNYLRDMRTNYPALQPLAKGGFDYNKAKFKDSLDNIRTSLAQPASQTPIDQAPPKENSQKLNRILSYIDQNAEQLKYTAKSSCDKKYDQIYDTVAMAVSGQVMKNSAIIAGSPGIGKTHVVTQVLHDRGFSRILEGNPKPNQYLYNNGSIGTSQESVIWFFYQHRDHEIIVLDDCDGFLATENPSLNNMLKALLTTGKEGGKVTVKDLRLRGRLSKLMEYDENRKLKKAIRESDFNDVNAFEEIFGKMYNKNTDSYQTQDTDDYENDIDDSLETEDLRDDPEETLETKSEEPKSNLKFPEVFEFTSKVICISNLRLRDIDSAVTSRSNCCEIYLTPAEFMVRLDEIKDTLGNSSCRVDLDVYKWHKDCCIDALEIALEAYEKGITINGRRVEINSDLEFRIITALADYSIAKTKFSGRDVLSYTEDQRWSHIYRLLSENCLDMLAQVK